MIPARRHLLPLLTETDHCRVYLSPDAFTSLRACIAIRPPGVPETYVFWNRKRPTVRLSIKAIQQKMARNVKAAGITASCYSLRHTFASNLLEYGVEIVTIKEFLGHASVTSNERYAQVPNRKVKQEYLRTMKKVLQRSKV